MRAGKRARHENSEAVWAGSSACLFASGTNDTRPLWLRSIYADTVIFTGVDTAICVENTLTDAFNIGYDVILVEDAVASSWQMIGQATVRKVAGSYGWVVDTEPFIAMLHSCKSGPGSFRLSRDYL